MLATPHMHVKIWLVLLVGLIPATSPAVVECSSLFTESTHVRELLESLARRTHLKLRTVMIPNQTEGEFNLAAVDRSGTALQLAYRGIGRTHSTHNLVPIDLNAIITGSTPGFSPLTLPLMAVEFTALGGPKIRTLKFQTQVSSGGRSFTLIALHRQIKSSDAGSQPEWQFAGGPSIRVEPN